ncbi:MAG: glycosyltransferase family 2 protein [Firmicutes bacterium]|nr:glycosyltransferase family 2 protein [Bacillota bacterium]
MRSTSVLIPAYNEAERIAATLVGVRSLPVSEVIVVDDGSHDATASVALSYGARVITLPQNVGKGGAIQHALTEVRGEILLLLDADLGNSARHALALLTPLYSGQTDMTVAAFAKRQRPGGGIGLTVGLARWSISLITGQSLSAPLSGQRALRSDDLRRLLPLPRDFGFEVGLTIKALKMGLSITEIPLPLEHRVTGRSLRDILHRGRQFCQICRVIIRSQQFASH